MCTIDGKWDERLHQRTVNLCTQDINEGRKGRGCVNKTGTKDLLESDRTKSINQAWKQKLIKATR